VANDCLIIGAPNVMLIVPIFGERYSRAGHGRYVFQLFDFPVSACKATVSPAWKRNTVLI